MYQKLSGFEELRGKKFNLHTHTTRCKHAAGTEREYVERAIEAGFEVLGFSDHAPYLFEDGHVSRIRMDMSELEDYTRTIHALKQEYKKDIQIYCGLEMEYFPALYENTMTEIQKFPIEYFILGQHYFDTEGVGKYTGSKWYDEAHLKKYADCILEALRTENFLYVAHADIINYVGFEEKYEFYMLQILNELKRRNIPVEVNVNGLRDRIWYPSQRFMDLAVKNQNQFIIGVDAHNPEDLIDYKTYQEALNMVKNGILC